MLNDNKNVNNMICKNDKKIKMEKNRIKEIK